MIIYTRITTEKLKIKELFDKLDVKDQENANEQLKFPLLVNTPYGFKKIITVFRTEKQKTITTYFKNNKTLKTSGNHLLKVNGEWKKVKDIADNDIIETETGTTSIVRKHISEKDEILYDISVEEVHCYYSNGILSHNSWFLQKLGSEALKQGKNVVHFTMELNPEYTGRRYDSCLSGINFNDVPTNKEKIIPIVNNLPGKLMIKDFPPGTASAQTLEMYIERYQMIMNLKVDVVIVDYADLLKPNAPNKNSNSYSEGEEIYTELRCLAGKLDVFVPTASQCNREGSKESIIMGHHMADSYQKLMISDFVMSFSRKLEDKAIKTANIHVIKNRFGNDGNLFVAHFNADNGDIKIYDKDSSEGKLLAAKMKAVSKDDVEKDILRDNWNKMKKNKSNF